MLVFYKRPEKRRKNMIHPKFNNLVVRVDMASGSKESKTAGGIVIPGKVVKTPLMRGVVQAVGPGYWHPEAIGNRVPICCDVGDSIWFRPQDMFFLDQVSPDIALVPDTSIMAVERTDAEEQEHAKRIVDAMERSKVLAKKAQASETKA